MPLRVVFDSSVVLAQMTLDLRDGSIIWQWMSDGVVRPVVSDYSVSTSRLVRHLFVIPMVGAPYAIAGAHFCDQMYRPSIDMTRP